MVKVNVNGKAMLGALKTVHIGAGADGVAMLVIAKARNAQDTDKLMVQTSNGNVAAASVVGVSAEGLDDKPVTAFISYATLNGVVSSMVAISENLTIEIDGLVNVVSGDNRVTIPLSDAKSFVMLKESDDDKVLTFTVDSHTFKDAIVRASHRCDLSAKAQGVTSQVYMRLSKGDCEVGGMCNYMIGISSDIAIKPVEPLDDAFTKDISVKAAWIADVVSILGDTGLATIQVGKTLLSVQHGTNRAFVTRAENERWDTHDKAKGIIAAVCGEGNPTFEVEKKDIALALSLVQSNLADRANWSMNVSKEGENLIFSNTAGTATGSCKLLAGKDEQMEDYPFSITQVKDVISSLTGQTILITFGAMGPGGAMHIEDGKEQVVVIGLQKKAE